MLRKLSKKRIILEGVELIKINSCKTSIAVDILGPFGYTDSISLAPIREAFHPSGWNAPVSVFMLADSGLNMNEKWVAHGRCL